MAKDRRKVAVCENRADLLAGSDDWKRLCAAVRREGPDLLLLNELPFGPWVAAGPKFDRDEWERSVDAHRMGMHRLGELGSGAVALTMPTVRNGKRLNEAVVWSKRGVTPVHSKQYFPDEEGYYEARWFQGGGRHFVTSRAGGLKCGFLICTELMFNEHARRYGRSGAEILLVPRATGGGSLERWLVAMPMAAIVSGCYVLSSNRSGTDGRGQTFGGAGWIVSPAGEVVARTSRENPVVSCEIDLKRVKAAQKDYPCYVAE